MSGKKGMKTKKLLESFLPYYGRYKKILIFDLFCAALTTLGELILPLMLRYITNQGMQNLASMTAGIVIRIGGLYLLLRIIDSLAAYYMAYTGHVMGVYIETDMRQDAFEHLQMLSDSYYSNTKVGQIMSRITSDLFDVTEFAHHCWATVWSGPLPMSRWRLPSSARATGISWILRSIPTATWRLFRLPPGPLTD